MIVHLKHITHKALQPITSFSGLDFGHYYSVKGRFPTDVEGETSSLLQPVPLILDLLDTLETSRLVCNLCLNPLYKRPNVLTMVVPRRAESINDKEREGVNPFWIPFIPEWGVGSPQDIVYYLVSVPDGNGGFPN